MTEQIISERHNGYIPSPKDLRDYKLNKKVCKTICLPNEYKVEHSEIKNQGAVGSCVAHSVCEIMESLYNNSEKYSTAWIYGYRPSNYYQGEGMIPLEACKTIVKIGYILYDDLKGNVEMPQAKRIVDENLKEFKNKANERKAVSFARLYSINEIKEAIYSTNNPILMAIMLGNNGIDLDENGIAYIPNTTSGGHAIVCYGWNESGLLIQNSWGKEWGINGCFILPYDYEIAEAWLITTKEDNLISPPKHYGIRNLLMKIKKSIFN